MNIKRLIFSPIEVNTYILWDESGECAVVDCGCYNETEFNELVSFLEEHALKPVILLNTHLHLDHIFGNRFIKDKAGLLTHASKEEEYNLISSPAHAQLFGMEMPEPPGIGTFIKEGDLINFGNSVLSCLSVPGHTAGSIAFYSEKDRFVITGDALFAGSIGRTDLPGGDYDTLLKSIRENLLTLDGNVKVYPGHGPSTTIDAERRNNPYLV